MRSDTGMQDWATSWMKLGVCKRVSRNEGEPSCKPRYTTLEGWENYYAYGCPRKAFRDMN
jgi:hypothetical protein